MAALPAQAATIYSGLEDLAIPTNFAGIYLDLDTGATSSAAFTGWDVNPFFGGAGLGNSAAFQPVRVGSSNLDAVLKLAPGTIVSSSLLYASGVGGSGNPGHEHLGANIATQFQPGSEGYLGFKVTTNNSAGPYFGWMRVVFTANGGGALVKDWAYETSGGSIGTGNVIQSAPVGGVQMVTLSGGGSENYTLSNPLANTSSTTALVKNGAGSWSLNGEQTFTGATTINAGTLDLGGSARITATSSITINSGGTLLLGAANGLSQLADSAPITLAGGTLARGGLEGLQENVGRLTLSATSTIDFGASSNDQTLRFADSHLATWTGNLNIWNWTRGVDHLDFGNSGSGLSVSQLSRIRFYSDGGTTEIGAGFSPVFSGSLGEVVPVPEPGSALSAAALLGLAALREQRRGRGCAVRQATRRGRPAGS